MNAKKDSKILITGATGATGGEAIRLLLQRGYQVRAFAHREDERSRKLQELGVEVVFGDFLNLDDVSAALKGIERAYFCYPISPGIIKATAIFAQAAKEAGVEAIVNMSQKSSRRDAKSQAAREHWLAENVFDWSGIPVTHLRPTFFAEWLLYSAADIREGSLILPLDPNARHAPVAADDQARVIAAILESPQPHQGQIYPLYGPREYTQPEIAKLLSSVLARNVEYKHMNFEAWKAYKLSRAKGAALPAQNTATAFYGGTDHVLQHVQEIAVDHKNGIFAGTNDYIQQIGGQPPTTLEEFIKQHKAAFE